MSADDLFTLTGLVASVTVTEVDVTAGGDEHPETRVTFLVQEEYFGTAPSQELTYLLPEGQTSDGGFTRIVGAPKFISGNHYIVFLQNGDWFDTPVTNFWFGAYRLVELDGKIYPVTESGQCVGFFFAEGIFHAFSVTPPQPIPFRVEAGEQTFLHTASTDPADEGDLADCRDVDQFVAAIEELSPEFVSTNLQFEPADRGANDVPVLGPAEPAEPVIDDCVVAEEDIPCEVEPPPEVVEDGKVNICHIPPGNPKRQRVLNVSLNSLDAHLRHGDLVGVCTERGGRP